MTAVSYAYYSDTYHGKLAEPEFIRLSVLAKAYLSELTMGRSDKAQLTSVAEKLKLAWCAVVDAYALNERGGGIAAETNDGISVTYVAGVGNALSEGRRLYAAAALYLGGTGLLYRGG